MKTKGRNKARDRRKIRKVGNRDRHGVELSITKMLGRYAQYNWGAGI